MLKSNLLQYISGLENEVLTDNDKIDIAEMMFDCSLPAMTLSELLNIVMAFFNLDRQQIMEKTRRREILVARHYFYYVAVRMYNYPLCSTGKVFNQNHATVYFATRQIENMMEIYHRDRILLERLKIEIKRFAVEKRIKKGMD